MSDQEPLLPAAEPTSSDPLLGRVAQQDRLSTYHRRRRTILIAFGIAFLLLVAFTVAGFFFTTRHKGDRNKNRKPNVILMISDGFGPASETLARNYYQYTHDVPESHQLPLDTILVGAARTRSSDSFVTDSAAGATAYACGIKTYNGAIGVNPEHKPCGTVLESAKDKGYLTGLVVTSRVTHATPACFAAHADSRTLEDEIALHEIGNYTLGRSVDLMFGGGSCFFKPNSEAGSCRSDDTNVYALAQESGWHVGPSDRSIFDALDPASILLPFLNLFTEDHMAFEIDRNDLIEPSLKDMTVKALDILTLSEENEKGFFLMVEGSRIDMAAHNNDPAAHVREILAYQDTVAAVMAYVDENPGTVMISVSDHETGGLSVGYQLDEHVYPDPYEWRPQALVNVKRSIEVIAPLITNFTGTSSELRAFVNQTVFHDWLDIQDPTAAEIKSVTAKGLSYEDTILYLGRAQSRRAVLGWATHGHSAVDVNLYAYGHNAEQLRGNIENTEIGKFIIRQMDLDVDAITAKLARLDVPSEGDVQARTTVKHYPSHT
ncbi:hypothetical protein HKX48_002311 [Thoreauomyces humboldtii]|nr:hypothetical protein HKX48_002311 [Thoreauomyces humboldtii]